MEEGALCSWAEMGEGGLKSLQERIPSDLSI